MTPIQTATAHAQGFEIATNSQLEHRPPRCPFRLRTVVYRWTATEAITFPRGKAANSLRGALGNLLRRQSQDDYERILNGRKDAGPSGLANPPRPFVLRAAHLDGATIAAGATFDFRLHLFDVSLDLVLERAWSGLPAVGLGPERRKIELTGVDRTDLEIDLAESHSVDHLKVTFLTPTELKSGTVLHFGCLAGRIRDRLSNLRQLYGEGPIPIDFKEYSRKADEIQCLRANTHLVEVLRRSSRTGQTHSLGGVLGEAEFTGDLGDFVSYFAAAAYTGVGRQTTFGKGEIAIEY